MIEYTPELERLFDQAGVDEERWAAKVHLSLLLRVLYRRMRLEFPTGKCVEAFSSERAVFTRVLMSNGLMAGFRFEIGTVEHPATPASLKMRLSQQVREAAAEDARLMR